MGQQKDLGPPVPVDPDLPRHPLRRVSRDFRGASMNTLRNWIDWLNLAEERENERGDRVLSDHQLKVLTVGMTLREWKTQDLVRLIMELEPDLDKLAKVIKEYSKRHPAPPRR